MAEKSDNDYAQAVADALNALNKAIYDAKHEGGLEVFAEVREEHNAPKVLDGPAFDPKVQYRQYVKAAVVRNYLKGA